MRVVSPRPRGELTDAVVIARIRRELADVRRLQRMVVGMVQSVNARFTRCAELVEQLERPVDERVV